MDTEAVLTLIQEVAAQVITPRFRALAHGEVMEKSPGDLVTIADHEAEELIERALQGHDPQALIVGEEAASANPDLIRQLAGAEHAYLVDPVDGTKNFVHGSANHAVMVAELRRGETVRAWIWQPEHQRSYVAERGAGCLRNGQRLPPLVPPTEPEDLRVLTSRPGWEGTHQSLTIQPSAWCCGVDYAWLVEGNVDAIIYSRSLPWDHAPGALMVEEMGGIVRYRDGSPFTPSRQESVGLVAAASPEVWDTVVMTAGLLVP